jgi:hypothetical protein
MEDFVRNLKAFLSVWILLGSVASGQSHKDRVEMPIHLDKGQIRTPAFSLKRHWFLIDLYVQTDASFETWCCLISADKNLGGVRLPACARSDDHRLHVTWKLWNGSDLVAQGPQKGESICGAKIGEGDFFLGTFHAKSGISYTLELDVKNVDADSHFGPARLVIWPTPEM